MRIERRLPGGFGEPSRAHLREQMRAVVRNPAEAAARGRRARTDMERRYSLEAVGDVVMGRLAEIGAELSGASAARERARRREHDLERAMRGGTGRGRADS